MSSLTFHSPLSLQARLIWATRTSNPLQAKLHYRAGITIWHVETGGVKLEGAGYQQTFEAPCCLVLGEGWISHTFLPESTLTSVSVRILSNDGPLFTLPPVWPIRVEDLPADTKNLVKFYDQRAEERDSRENALFQVELHLALGRWCWQLAQLVTRDLENPFVPPIRHPGLRQGMVWLYNQRRAERITEQEIAKVAGMSVSHFKRVFQREMGVPLREYFRRAKVDACIEALIHTDKPVKQIGVELGFATSGNFVRWFRKHFDQTPVTYRGSH